jgi:Amt family ammonium transporter
MFGQLWTQFKAVCLTLVWSGVGTLVLLTLVRLVIGLRPGTDQEREGLDLVDHGERAYNY